MLDAYESERRATAWWHQRAAQRHMAVQLEIGDLYAAAGDIEDNTPEAAHKREALGRRIAAIGNGENESGGVELGYRYEGSPVICGEADLPAIDPLVYRPNTAPGASLPHVFIEPGVSVHGRLGLCFTLLAVDDVDSAARS